MIAALNYKGLIIITPRNLSQRKTLGNLKKSKFVLRPSLISSIWSRPPSSSAFSFPLFRPCDCRPIATATSDTNKRVARVSARWWSGPLRNLIVKDDRANASIFPAALAPVSRKNLFSLLLRTPHHPFRVSGLFYYFLFRRLTRRLCHGCFAPRLSKKYHDYFNSRWYCRPIDERRVYPGRTGAHPLFYTEPCYSCSIPSLFRDDFLIRSTYSHRAPVESEFRVTLSRSNYPRLVPISLAERKVHVAIVGRRWSAR